MRVRAAFLPGLIVALIGFAATQPAMAHVTIAGADDFTAGLLHPFFVLSHLLAIVGLGLFLAQQDIADARPALAAFVLALAGGFAGAALDLAAVFPARGVLLGAAVILGLLVAWGRAWPRAIVAAAAAAVGFAIAIDSFPEEGTVRSNLLTVIGTGLSVSLTLVNILAVAGYLTRDWQRIGLRVLGSWIGASALMVAALAMR